MDKIPTKGEFLEVLLRSSKSIFSTKDAALLWNENNNSVITDRLKKYVKTGKLVRPYRGLYAKDKDYNRFELATRIYTPSYISFETVLTRAGINFQFYGNIFVASYVTRDVKAGDQKISFIRMKDYVLSNTVGIEHSDGIATATKERAFLDRIYISKDYHFDNLNALDWNKVFEILPIYNNKRMEKKVKQYHQKYEDGELIKKHISVKIKEDMFAHKLMAMHERIGKTSRDVYDVWFFLENHWPINKEIVKQRSGKTFKEILQLTAEQLEKLNNKHILDGLGDFLTEPQKDWARAKLKSETIFLLKARAESEK